MGRQARIDYTGAFHHIMVKGIARCELFTDKNDRQEFLDRLAIVINDTATPCLAFALMPTHFHLLLVTGTESISSVMASLLIRYAAYYNRRHKSNGKLYQNRFKSILCDQEEYLLTLTRYIHLNPIRGGLKRTLSQLDIYPWTSHASYMGNNAYPWLQTGEVLNRFGCRVKTARKKYFDYISEGLREEGGLDINNGLSRTFDGAWESKDLRGGSNDKFFESIMGSSTFTENVLKNAREHESKASRLQGEGWDCNRVLSYAAGVVGLDDPAELFTRSRNDIRAHGRALFCKWLADDLKMKQTVIATYLGLSPAPVSRLVKHGRILEQQLGVTLDGK